MEMWTIVSIMRPMDKALYCVVEERVALARSMPRIAAYLEKLIFLDVLENLLI